MRPKMSYSNFQRLSNANTSLFLWDTNTVSDHPIPTNKSQWKFCATSSPSPSWGWCARDLCVTEVPCHHPWFLGPRVGCCWLPTSSSLVYSHITLEFPRDHFSLLWNLLPFNVLQQKENPSSSSQKVIKARQIISAKTKEPWGGQRRRVLKTPSLSLPFTPATSPLASYWVKGRFKKVMLTNQFWWLRAASLTCNCSEAHTHM